MAAGRGQTHQRLNVQGHARELSGKFGLRGGRLTSSSGSRSTRLQLTKQRTGQVGMLKRF